jgi:hypothetical protein
MRDHFNERAAIIEFDAPGSGRSMTDGFRRKALVPTDLGKSSQRSDREPAGGVLEDL